MGAWERPCRREFAEECELAEMSRLGNPRQEGGLLVPQLSQAVKVAQAAGRLRSNRASRKRRILPQPGCFQSLDRSAEVEVDFRRKCILLSTCALLNQCTKMSVPHVCHFSSASDRTGQAASRARAGGDRGLIRSDGGRSMLASWRSAAGESDRMGGGTGCGSCGDCRVRRAGRDGRAAGVVRGGSGGNISGRKIADSPGAMLHRETGT